MGIRDKNKVKLNNLKVAGKWCARRIQNDDGSWEDEYNRDRLVVFPFTSRRASARNMRQLTDKEAVQYELSLKGVENNKESQIEALMKQIALLEDKDVETIKKTIAPKKATGK